LRIPESSRRESPVKHGTRLTCAESLSVYGPIVVVAFIHPDFEIVRTHVFSEIVHPLGVIPPIPLSGVQVQLDRVHSIDADTEAVNVTDCALVMLRGEAVTLNCGGVMVITGLCAGM